MLIAGYVIACLIGISGGGGTRTRSSNQIAWKSHQEIEKPFAAVSVASSPSVHSFGKPIQHKILVGDSGTRNVEKLLTALLLSYLPSTSSLPMVARSIRLGFDTRFTIPKKRCRHEASIMTAEFPLETEEREAIAGIWSANLDLGDGYTRMTFALSSSGKLTATSPDSSMRGSWEAGARRGRSDISMRLFFGPWVLTGHGERRNDAANTETNGKVGLRCKAIDGVVLEGILEPCCVGKFNLTLALPYANDEQLAVLDKRHKTKVAKRRAPPYKFNLTSFIGRWKLLIMFEDSDEPTYSSIVLSANRTFVSDTSGSGMCLAGKWGVWDEEAWMQGGEARKLAHRSIALVGTHLWLEFSRTACKGISQPNWQQEDISMWGQPTLESPEAELRAKQPGGGSSDLVQGRIYFGAFGTVGSPVQGGRFSLVRATNVTS